MTPCRPHAVHSFETFIATAAAVEALDLCRTFAGTGPDAPRLLVLHGPPGSGKTHLLQAILHAIHERDPSLAVLRTSSMECVHDLVAELRPADAHLPRLWPAGSVVTIDDLHVLSGKPATQTEIGRQIRSAIEGGSRLACSVGRLDEVPQLMDTVRGFPSVRLAALARPGERDMAHILDVMARAEGWSLSPESLASMAAACQGDVRHAASAITRLRFEASLVA
jgi:chromosomal replication initiator protein